MTVTYSDLLTFQECPRRWAWGTRYESLTKPKNYLRGIFLHSGAAAVLGQEPAIPAIKARMEQEKDHVAALLNDDGAVKQFEVIRKAGNEAVEMLQIYQPLLSQLKPVYLKPSVSFGHVFAAPDALVNYQGRTAILHIVTGDDPPLDALDLAGKADVEAHLLMQREIVPDYVILDVLPYEKPPFRHMRPANKLRGMNLAAKLNLMALASYDLALDDPHFGTRCQFCPFLRACKVAEAGGDPDDVLMQHYLPREVTA